MKKQIKKLKLKKNTVFLIGADNKMVMLGGQPQRSMPDPTCTPACQPSMMVPCNTGTA